MKVVALVSGGKDSCYSMLRCTQHGHMVVALANLLPPDASVDELDSYMYQTVGHQLVEAYAACTGLPLYRRRIVGGPKSQGLTYSVTRGDEVEDLAALLAFVKERHPEVQAVASGAIASDYQRLRVEEVCGRLGLVSLAYLWHRPQEELLGAMIDSGIEAVLVKVAALGLDPHRHLGRTLSQMRPALLTLRDRFGCNVCGEGGEYETLTLDCPAFTKGRIVLDSWEVRMHSPDSVAPVGVLHPTAFHIEAKGVTGSGDAGDAGDAGRLAAEAVVEVPLDFAPPPPAPRGPSTADSSSNGAPEELPSVAVRLSPRHALLTCAATGGTGPAGPDRTAAAVHAALRAVGAALPSLGLSWDDSLFVHLYLSNMAHFGAANAAYCQHLPSLSPPSRACVQLPLPPGTAVALDVLFALPPATDAAAAGNQPRRGAAARRRVPPELPRRVLHVQSISDWAPSCIGPYSQATSRGGLIHMAGQIPLDPGSMTITPGGLPVQARLALANTQAVAVAAGGCLGGGCLGLTVYLSPDAGGSEAGRQVGALLRELRRDPAAFVACAERQRLRQTEPVAAAAAGAAAGSSEGGSDGGEDGGSDDGGFVDDYLKPPATALRLRPSVVYVEVPALPRGALLEVQPLLLDLARGAGAAPSSSSSSDDEREKEEEEQRGAAATAAGGTAAAAAGVMGAAAPAPVVNAAAVAVAAQHVATETTACPAGARVRVLLTVRLPAAADGAPLPALAAAAAGALSTAAAAVARPAGTDAPAFASVRAWCRQGAVDAGEWRGALECALGSSSAVQSVPVAAVWVARSGDGGGAEEEEEQCCIAVEAVACG